MPVTRTYACDDCGNQWSYLHLNRDDPVPECAMCLSKAAPKQLIGSFNIGTVKSKAIDYTWKMAQERYGMTDMRDNSYEGDAAALPPSPVQTAEADQLTRLMKEASPEMSSEQADMTKSFWQKGAAPPMQQALTQTAMANAAQTRQDGLDPMGLVHQGEKATGGRMKLEVIGRAKLTDIAS